MDGYENLRRAVDFMEANLKSVITPAQIASAAGYSVAQFHRVFTAVAGITAAGYLRRRRLSQAAVELKTTGGGILDIALDYGFESHEAFTRAFRAAYGLPPSRFRTQCAPPLLYEKINIRSMKKEGTPLITPTIRLKGPINLVGLARHMTQDENLRQGLIGQAQREFRQIASILSGRASPHLFYAAYDYRPEDIGKDDDDIAYTYWFCVETDAEPPQGLARKTLPRAKFAEFLFDPARQTLNGQPIGMPLYDYIDGVWLPESGLKLSGQPDYEVHDDASGIIEVNISIE